MNCLQDRDHHNLIMFYYHRKYQIEITQKFISLEIVFLCS